MKKIALIAALAATVAAPAFAQSASTLFAIQHFNMSATGHQDIVTVPRGDSNRVAVTNGTALGNAFNAINANEDSAINFRGQNGATIVSGTNTHGADIFARLRAQSLEDE